MSSLLGYPAVVNEKAARTVAAVVAASCALVLVTGWYWLLVPIAYGFIARVLAGPRLDPLAAVVQRSIAPRLGSPRRVAGPPKQFAQGIGAVVTVAAGVAALAFGAIGLASILLGMMVLFAGLEAAIGFCVGCRIFGLLMRIGVIPADVCAACNDISLTRQPA